jgi:hypothetical protein
MMIFQSSCTKNAAKSLKGEIYAIQLNATLFSTPKFSGNFRFFAKPKSKGSLFSTFFVLVILPLDSQPATSSRLRSGGGGAGYHASFLPTVRKCSRKVKCLLKSSAKVSQNRPKTHASSNSAHCSSKYAKTTLQGPLAERKNASPGLKIP